MKNLLRKKHNGNMGDIIGSLVVISIVLIVLTSCINCFTILSKKISLDRIARNSILVLEINGTLTDAEKTEIIDQVTAMNLNHVTLEINNNAGKSAYGEAVTIEIIADATGDELSLFGSLPIWDDTFNFSTRYSSISKAAR